MTEDIRQFLSSIEAVCPEISATELEEFGQGLTVNTFNKKDFYTRTGQVQKEIGFVTKGLIRAFYIDENGNEKTVRFIKEHQYVGYYAAFLSQQPSDYCFRCLEPTTIVNIPFGKIQQAYLQSPTFERYGRLIAEENLKIQQARTKSFLFQNAEERYLDFIHKNPQLFNRIPLSHLCSYLGVERQSLTRIRKKITSRNRWF